MNYGTPNARFWELVNDDWVKITLRPGQLLTHYVRGPTDEGWSARGVEFEHQGNHVRTQVIHDGSDCDGRLTRTWNGRCTLGKLHTREVEPEFAPPVGFAPEWTEESAWRRDYVAERAGY